MKARKANPKKLLGWNRTVGGLTVGWTDDGQRRYDIEKSSVRGTVYFTVTSRGEHIGERGTLGLAKALAEEDAQRRARWANPKKGRKASRKKNPSGSARTKGGSYYYTLTAGERGRPRGAIGVYNTKAQALAAKAREKGPCYIKRHHEAAKRNPLGGPAIGTWVVVKENHKDRVLPGMVGVVGKVIGHVTHGVTPYAKVAWENGTTRDAPLDVLSPAPRRPKKHNPLGGALTITHDGPDLLIRHEGVHANPSKHKRSKKNPHLGRHGLAHKAHPMLGLDKEQVRATAAHLRKLQEARKQGYKGSYTTDPQWLVEQAINRRGGYVDDPGGRRGSAIPVKGKFPKKGGGDLEADLWRISRDVNTPRLRVYEQRLGSWKKELTKRLPHRFVKPGEEDW